MRLLDDVIRMRAAVLLHPLCRTFAHALRTSSVPDGRAISLCLGHLDDCALAAARTALHNLSCTTGITINDSLYISRRSPITSAAALASANAAASHTLLFPVTFSYLPHLTKTTEPEPTLASLAVALADAPLSPPASGSSTPAELHPADPPLPSPAPSSGASNLLSEPSDREDDLPYDSPPHPTSPSGTPTSPSQSPTGSDVDSDYPSPSFSPSCSAPALSTDSNPDRDLSPMLKI